MVVGALAVSIWGFPRATNDLDFVIHLPFSERARVVSVIRGLGVDEIEEAKDEFGQRLVFDGGRGLKVELFFTPPNVVYDREYGRRRTVVLHGEPVPVISPEDLVLRKLVNVRLRRGIDYQDVVHVLQVSGPTFDHAYLRAHCALYRVCDLFERAVAEAARRA